MIKMDRLKLWRLTRLSNHYRDRFILSSRITPKNDKKTVIKQKILGYSNTVNLDTIVGNEEVYSYVCNACGGRGVPGRPFLYSDGRGLCFCCAANHLPDKVFKNKTFKIGEFIYLWERVAPLLNKVKWTDEINSQVNSFLNRFIFALDSYKTNNHVRLGRRMRSVKVTNQIKEKYRRGALDDRICRDYINNVQLTTTGDKNNKG